jgi:hypothetical protein
VTLITTTKSAGAAVFQGMPFMRRISGKFLLKNVQRIAIWTRGAIILYMIPKVPAKLIKRAILSIMLA